MVATTLFMLKLIDALTHLLHNTVFLVKFPLPTRNDCMGFTCVYFFLPPGRGTMYSSVCLLTVNKVIFAASEN